METASLAERARKWLAANPDEGISGWPDFDDRVITEWKIDPEGMVLSFADSSILDCNDNTAYSDEGSYYSVRPWDEPNDTN